MRVYEINLKEESEGTYNTSYFEPEDIYQSKSGSLFIASSLEESGIPQTQLLSRLSQTIKNSFYSQKKGGVDKRLRASLKEGNEFLRQRLEDGSAEWMSSFGFATLALQKGEEVMPTSFSRVGEVEMILLRAGETINLGEKANSEIEPYPLVVFSEVVSGSLTKKDRVLFLSKDVYSSFVKNNILKKLARISFLDKKTLSRVLAPLDDIEGFIFLVDLQESDEKIKKINIKRKKFLPLEEIKSNKTFKKIKKTKVLALIKEQLGSFPKIKLPRIPKIPYKKPTVLILSLLLLIGAGVFINQTERKIKKKEIISEIELIEEKSMKAKSHLLQDERVEANKLYTNALEDLNNLSPRLTPLAQEEIDSLQQEIESQLSKLNKTKEIEKFTTREEDDLFDLEGISDRFNNKIYIYKDGQINNNWLSQPLEDVNDIAIDGSIWIIFDKKIQEFYKGEFKQELSISVFPSLERIRKAATNYESPTLYLLEDKRIILLDKETGSVKSQLQIDRDIIDLEVEDKTLYLLTSNEVLEVDLLQFN